MNNRVGGILILLSMGILGYIFYWYYFVYSLIDISFHSNVENFTISMESKKKQYDFECVQSSCKYSNISPFEYTIKLSAAGYKNIEYTWTPSKQNAQQNIIFEVHYELQKLETISQNEAQNILAETEEKKEETLQEKLQRIKKNTHIHFTLDTFKYNYSFQKAAIGMDMYIDKSFIGNIPYTKKDGLAIYEVYGNSDYLVLFIHDKKYFLSKRSGKLSEFTLEIPITYIKSTQIQGEFIIVTQKGSFVYNVYQNSFEYNNQFQDFIFYDQQNYITIISAHANINRKVENISEGKYAVVLYTPINKEYKALLETDIQIQKIYIENDIVKLEDNDKMLYTIAGLTQ